MDKDKIKLEEMSKIKKGFSKILENSQRNLENTKKVAKEKIQNFREFIRENKEKVGLSALALLMVATGAVYGKYKSAQEIDKAMEENSSNYSLISLVEAARESEKDLEPKYNFWDSEITSKVQGGDTYMVDGEVYKDDSGVGNTYIIRTESTEENELVENSKINEETSSGNKKVISDDVDKAVAVGNENTKTQSNEKAIYNKLQIALKDNAKDISVDSLLKLKDELNKLLNEGYTLDNIDIEVDDNGNILYTGKNDKEVTGGRIDNASKEAINKDDFER